MSEGSALNGTAPVGDDLAGWSDVEKINWETSELKKPTDLGDRAWTANPAGTLETNRNCQ